MADLLVEIGTEEIPASYVLPALRGIATRLADAFTSARAEVGEPTLLASPRRMTLHWADFPARGSSLTTDCVGPAAKIAFDEDGNPTNAALGFARSQGVDPAVLRIEQTEKGAYVVVTVTREGESAAEILAAALPAALRAAPFPKTMRWTGSEIPFARPIRNLVVMHGAEPVEVEAAGVRSGRSTRGHPFLAPEPFDLETADLEAYREALRSRRTIVDHEERRTVIREEIGSFIGRARAGEVEEALLDEVVFLTEFPRVIEGRIDPKYLELPVEILETAMRVHLRFFPVMDAAERPEPRFLAVMNRTMESEDTVREGNERVLRSRLDDARFFIGKDRQLPLTAFVGKLAGKSFHRELGSYSKKMDRLTDLAGWLAGVLEWKDVASKAERAAHLAKADLVTELVGEFPELQGTVGRIYALLDGEDTEVAQAIEDQYRPRGPEDRIPEGRVSAVVSLAEKLDNLAAFFSIGGAPTGSSDPFGLRRQALGILRILKHNSISLSLSRAVRTAVENVGIAESDEPVQEILAYLRDRLYQNSTDEGHRYDLARAALAVGADDVLDYRQRLIALEDIARKPWWPRLVEVVERTANILRGSVVESKPNESLLADTEERVLFRVLEEEEPAIRELLARGSYREAARAYADAFAGPVHAFFDSVYVNVDDSAIRENRRALLARVNELFAATVADLSRVEKPGDPS